MAYKAPIWEDGKSPAVSAENLNALSQAAEGAQVLYGNSAPTSSTEGAVGQFYLVVVADSDGNYPLYQCVAIANGAYTWRDTREIPNSIASSLGIPRPYTINNALNVLANIGNVHVWQRVLNTDIPAHISETELSNVEVFYATSRSVNPTNYNYSTTYSVSDSVSVDDAGNISLVNPTTVDCYIQNSSYSTFVNEASLKGKYVKVVQTNNSYVYNRVLGDGVWKIPSDATFSVSNPEDYTGKVTVSKAYRCVGFGITKSGIADYLTSTDENAYPKQSAEGGQDASYVLGDVVSDVVYLGFQNASGFAALEYADSVSVGDDGIVTLVNSTPINIGHGATNQADDIGNLIVGKFIAMSSNGSMTAGEPTLSVGKIVYIPDTATVSYELAEYQYTRGYFVLSKYQPVTGYPAIPANTVITYLGQLGEAGARIEVGSYVGTGTYGSSNPNSLTASFPIKIAIIGNYKSGSTDVSATAIFLPMGCATTFNKHGYFFSDYDSAMQDQYKYSKISKDGKTLYWYESRYAKEQLNVAARTYFYVLIG